MGIEQSQTIDLRDAKIFDFVQQPGEAVYESEDPELLPGFEREDPQHPLGTSRQERFVFGVSETWSIFEKAQYVTSVAFVIPHTRAMTITTISFLQVRKDVAQDVRDQIKKSLTSYDPSSGMDPVEWARDAMPEGEEGFSLFDVQQKFSLKRLGAQAEPHQDAVVARDEALARLAPDESYEAKLVGSTTVDEVPELVPPVQDVSVPNEQAVEDPAEADKGVEQILKMLSPSGCDLMKPWKQKIGTFFVYPEFKLTWELRSITIGCIRVKLHLPVLYVRVAKVQLWVFGAWPHDPLGILEGIVKKCSLVAVGAGVVVGLVFVNFGAATAAFEAVFITCFVQSSGQPIKCIVPSLMLLTHRTPWAAVW